MGYIRHDAILVTSWNDKEIEAAAARARIIGLDVLGPSSPAANGYRTITVCPDGNKEGWEESSRHEEMRAIFLQYLYDVRYEDGSTCLEWAAISYGSDDRNARVLSHAWAGEQQ